MDLGHLSHSKCLHSLNFSSDNHKHIFINSIFRQECRTFVMRYHKFSFNHTDPHIWTVLWSHKWGTLQFSRKWGCHKAPAFPWNHTFPQTEAHTFKLWMPLEIVYKSENAIKSGELRLKTGLEWKANASSTFQNYKKNKKLCTSSGLPFPKFKRFWWTENQNTNVFTKAILKISFTTCFFNSFGGCTKEINYFCYWKSRRGMSCMHGLSTSISHCAQNDGEQITKEC